MKAKILFLLWFFSSLSWGADFSAPAVVRKNIAADPKLVAEWSKYDGRLIRRIDFVGLKRTKAEAIIWRIKSRPTGLFNAQTLAEDISHIYNTGVLYDVSAEVTPLGDNGNSLDIVISVKDKWTLLPVAGAQGGGGSNVYAYGFYEANLLGYLVRTFAIVYNYNGATSYLISANYKKAFGSDLDLGFRLNDDINPIILHRNDGSSAGNFTWRRHMQAISIGRDFTDRFRVKLTTTVYEDSLLKYDGVLPMPYSGTQYDEELRITLGEINLLNYLEQGAELSARMSSSNFAGPSTQHNAGELSYKYIEVLPHENSWAFFINTGVCTPAPAPYLYNLGGYGSIRGFIEYQEVGPYFARSNLEFRPLLGTMRTDFLDLDQIALQGVIFSDLGSAWGETQLTGEPEAGQFRTLWSMGLGARVHFVKLAGAVLRIDVAKTLQPNLGWGMTFGFAQFF